MQLSIESISNLLPKRFYQSLPIQTKIPNMPPMIGQFSWRNRNITVHLTDTMIGRNTTQPHTDLSKAAQRELVQRYSEAFMHSEWLTDLSKQDCHAVYIFAVDRDDPYRPDVPFALAHFVDQDGNRVGAGRAYKTYGRPQPAFKPPILLKKAMENTDNEEVLTGYDETSLENSGLLLDGLLVDGLLGRPIMRGSSSV